MPPFVPGFTITGVTSSNAIGTQWGAVRRLDGRHCVLEIIPVPDVRQALEVAARQIADYDQIDGTHLVRRHAAIAVGDGAVALVLDEVGGGTLSQLLGSRGQLTCGETVTTVAPLLKTLADLHAADIVHGGLGPGNVLFTGDGRPLIGSLGESSLVARPVSGTPRTGGGGFLAPELVDGGEPRPASDVYAMAALAWFCLTGGSPGPEDGRPSLSSLRPEAPALLVEVVTACLSADPGARPSAGEAAVAVFDSAPAESVALAPLADPAAEITRRIRAAALAVADPAPSGFLARHRTGLTLGTVALLLIAALAGGAAWLSGRLSADAGPVAARSVAQPSGQPVTVPTTAPGGQQPTRALATMPATMRRATPAVTRAAKPARTAAAVPERTAQNPADVLTVAGSPQSAPVALLQALVDARALAYLTRDPALLDLVYAPGASKAEVDRANIATALKNGGTYLGLAFVVHEVAFLDGTADTARIRASIVTAAYRTGQPDGRTIPHVQEILGPCIFSLSLTTDGWRVLALTVS